MSSANDDDEIVEDDLDELHLECWRKYSLFTLHGNVKTVDFMSKRQFQKFVTAMHLPKNKRINATFVDHIFSGAAQQGGGAKSSTITFQQFLWALDELGKKMYTKKCEMFGDSTLPQLEAFGKLMYGHVRN
jgi:hypothetical protein